MNTRLNKQKRIALMLITITVLGVLFAGVVIRSRDREELTVPGLSPAALQGHGAGTDAVEAISYARQAISGNDLDKAKAEVERARQLLNTLGGLLPTAKAKLAIEQLKNADAIDQDWVSIYKSLDEVTLFLPVVHARHYVDAAKQASDQGDKHAAQQALDAAIATLQYSETDLPLQATLSAVDKASTALQQGDTKTADSALKKAQQGIISITLKDENPLIEARYFAQLSYTLMQQGQLEQARDALDESLSYLDKASHSNDEASRLAANDLLTEAQALRKEMDTYLEQHKKPPMSNGEKILTDLKLLGYRAEAWSERALNFAHLKWDEQDTYSPMVSQLIEARFHVHNTAIDLLTAQQPAAAAEQLQQTSGNLEQAMQLAQQYWTDDYYKQRISAMQNSVNAMLKTPDNINTEQLDGVQKELQQIINAL